MFISLVYSIPLLLNAVIIVVRFHLYPPTWMSKTLAHSRCVQSEHLLMCTSPCSSLTDGVGVQDLFHHDWTEDTSAKEKSSPRKTREEWLSLLLMSIHGLRLKEFRTSPLLILNFGKAKQIPSNDFKRIVFWSRQCWEWISFSGGGCWKMLQ